MTQQLGITVSKKADFSEWFTQVVLKAELADYAPVKGFMVLRPNGYALWEHIRTSLDRRFKATGHRNAYFPALVPEDLLRKEAEHFAGFTPEVFWVTHAGDERLAERLAVRPTSETIAYTTYSKWIRSYRDLPLLLNFWNSVLRAEIKSTKPFIRTSEFLWQEGHTVHEDKEDADAEVMRILRIYRELCEEELAIPVLEGVKSEREKFKGALYTATLEALMPDGKALQLGTSHNLGQNFSKPFEIRFQGRDKQEHFAWQTSWGVSWRLIGALIMLHGDDRGLILPPRVALIQIVVVPIYYSAEEKERVMRFLGKVTTRLKRKRLRCHVDDREELTPGWKFNEWELRGVPLRVEVGPRDTIAGKAMLVRRDTGQRASVEVERVADVCSALLREIQNQLFQRAKAHLDASTFAVETYPELKAVVEAEKGLVVAGWCERRECEDAIKQETGADIRVIPFARQGREFRCVYCGRKTDLRVYYGRAY